MAEDRGRFGTALRISRVSTPELTNVPTSVTSLVAVPLLEVVLLVAVSASLGGTDLVVVAYAAIVVALGLTIISGTVGQVTRDRHLGVLHDILTYRPFFAPYWLGKVTIPAILGLTIAVASCVAVFAVDTRHDTAPLTAALAILPVVVVGASLVAVAVATLSAGFQDPFLVSNVAHGVLPISAGIVVPLSTYPDLLADLGRMLPFAGAVEAMRALALSDPVSDVALLVVREGAVCGAWLAVGIFMSRSVVRAMRDGRRREEIW